jgi:hypothetical protein
LPGRICAFLRINDFNEMAEAHEIKGLTGHKSLPCLCSRVSARLGHVIRVGFALQLQLLETGVKIDGPPEPVYTRLIANSNSNLEVSV